MSVPGTGLRARWLVAADGLHSPVRRSLGLEVATHHAPRYGLRRHYAVPPWTPYVEVHWGPHAEAYVTPLGPDLVGVALLTARRAPFATQLETFPELAARLPRRRPSRRCADRDRCVSALARASTAGCCSSVTPPDTSTR